MVSTDIWHIKSVSELRALSGLEKPTHPLICISDVSKVEIAESLIGQKIMYDMYSIALKDASCGLDYGRNTYDFNEGVMIFTAPGQVMSVSKAQKIGEINGWMLFFHPDLIRNTPLGQKIEEYQFFDYEVHEALHLSDTEQQTITDCISLIQTEINERIDNHSQTVIASTLELILNYANRFYERQFNTRSAQNSDTVAQFNSLLKQYYKQGLFQENGIPSINYFASKLHFSSNYLSDLLKKETGFTTKEHINQFIVKKAKTRLLTQNETVSELAYALGFNYPHYFSRMFKQQTGTTPQAYQKRN